MTKINFKDHTGATKTVEAENGSTVMEAAIRNVIPGILAECGGACACATCHVYVDEAWAEKTGAPSPMEEDMLDFLRRPADLAAVVPDQGCRRTRGPGRPHSRTAGLSGAACVQPFVGDNAWENLPRASACEGRFIRQRVDS
jgi:ferredoxin